jgi:trans-aconitate 2-methyltransferase
MKWKERMSDKKFVSHIWNPALYRLFEKQRNEPFYDLLKIVKRKKNMRILDLGCGSGSLTQVLHKTLKANYTLGIDRSLEMLKESKKIKEPNLKFQLIDIHSFLSSNQESFDLVFSNSCLQWLPDHQRLLPKLIDILSPKGQIAIQVPSNYDYPTHTIAKKLAGESPFKELIYQNIERSVLKPRQYAELLYELGLKSQSVNMQVYGHLLKSTESIIEWVQGTLLLYYQGLLPNSLYKEFFLIYRKRIFETFGYREPFFFPFQRILIYGRR